MFKKITLIIAVLMLAACASVPDSLQVAENQRLVTYPQVMANPQATTNDHARWGGVIAAVENRADSTMVEVVHHELSRNGRPKQSDESVGRFRAYVNGFLDPMIYKTGRSITFVGNINGTESGLVGEHKYMYPSLKASSYYMWDERSRVDVTSISVWPGGYWNNWYGWGMHPVHQRVIIRSRDRQGTDSNHSPSQPRTRNIEKPAGMGQNKHHADRRKKID